MSQLKPEQYSSTRSEAMELVSVLRRKYDVFFLNEHIVQLADFSENSFDAPKYIDEIAKSDYFIAIVVERNCSSIYFEAGYALALNKPSIYFVTKEEVIPSLMRVIGKVHLHVKINSVQSMNDINLKIDQLMDFSKFKKSLIS
jgi:nucleoside 2-deoxyribosyltransferase